MSQVEESPTHQTSDGSKSAVGLLAAGHVVNDLYQGAVPAILPFLAAAYGYSYLAISGLTLAATFISSIAQPLFGVLADRYRTRWIVSTGLFVAAAGVAASGMFSSYTMVWVVIAVSGVGVSAFHPEATRLTRRAAGASAQGMSWFALGGNVGFALAPLTVTPLLLVTGLTGTVWLIVPAIAMVVVLLIMLPRLLPEAGSRSEKAVVTVPDDVRSFLWLTLIVICRSVAFIGMGSFLALYVIRTFGTSTSVGAAAYTVFTITGTVATVLGGWLADRLGRIAAIRLGYLVAVPGFIGLVAAPNLAFAFVAILLCGLGIYIPFSVHTTLGQEYLPNRIGTASGVTLGLAVSAGGIASPGLGLLADSYGISAALVVLCATPVVALLASAKLVETHRRRSPVT